MYCRESFNPSVESKITALNTQLYLCAVPLYGRITRTLKTLHIWLQIHMSIYTH